jgi:hypothetical protein
MSRIPTMSGADLKALRDRLGLGTAAFGILLGYRGNRRNIGRTIRRYELEAGPLPPGLYLRALGVRLEADAGLHGRAKHG